MARALIAPELNRALTLMYHEVLREGGPASADPYKLGRAEFVRQMEAIRNAIGAAPVGRVDAPETWVAPRPLFLTFDDGQASAYDVVADLLEARVGARISSW